MYSCLIVFDACLVIKTRKTTGLKRLTLIIFLQHNSTGLAMYSPLITSSSQYLPPTYRSSRGKFGYKILVGMVEKGKLGGLEE